MAMTVVHDNVFEDTILMHVACMSLPLNEPKAHHCFPLRWVNGMCFLYLRIIGILGFLSLCGIIRYF